MVVGSLEACLECGGHREMKMGWCYKEKRLSRMHGGSGLASSYKKTTEDEYKRRQMRATHY
jgi:hypothetical protein